MKFSADVSDDATELVIAYATTVRRLVDNRTGYEHDIVAARCKEIDREMNHRGEGFYRCVWSLLSAPDRRIFKSYVSGP